MILDSSPISVRKAMYGIGLVNLHTTKDRGAQTLERSVSHNIETRLIVIDF